MGLAGAWYGACIAAYLAVFVFGFLIYKIDLEKELPKIKLKFLEHETQPKIWIHIWWS